MSEDRKNIKRALISVYDKTGLEDLARSLDNAGVEIVSTGSTAKKIADLGIDVTPVEKLTGFPECLEGRVKTLHPRVHAGILADTRKEDHLNQLQELEVDPFQLVVVNLYPFRETVASGADFDGCVEQIDIGGPSMVRAAAKNHPSVAVVVDPARYGEVADAVANGGFTLDQRRGLARDAFLHTADYDAAVSAWFVDQLSEGEETTPLRTTTTRMLTQRGAPPGIMSARAWQSSSTPTRVASRCLTSPSRLLTAQPMPATRCPHSAASSL